MCQMKKFKDLDYIKKTIYMPRIKEKTHKKLSKPFTLLVLVSVSKIFHYVSRGPLGGKNKLFFKAQVSLL